MAKRTVISFFTVLSLIITGVFVLNALAGEVPKMDKDELKGLLRNSDVIIIGVRLGKDCSASEFKIKGATREDKTEFSSWAEKYPKDKTIVLYCA